MPLKPECIPYCFQFQSNGNSRCSRRRRQADDHVARSEGGLETRHINVCGCVVGVKGFTIGIFFRLLYLEANWQGNKRKGTNSQKILDLPQVYFIRKEVGKGKSELSDGLITDNEIDIGRV